MNQSMSMMTRPAPMIPVIRPGRAEAVAAPPRPSCGLFLVAFVVLCFSAMTDLGGDTNYLSADYDYRAVKNLSADYDYRVVKSVETSAFLGALAARLRRGEEQKEGQNEGQNVNHDVPDSSNIPNRVIPDSMNIPNRNIRDSDIPNRNIPNNRKSKTIKTIVQNKDCESGVVKSEVVKSEVVNGKIISKTYGPIISKTYGPSLIGKLLSFEDGNGGRQHGSVRSRQEQDESERGQGVDEGSGSDQRSDDKNSSIRDEEGDYLESGNFEYGNLMTEYQQGRSSNCGELGRGNDNYQARRETNLERQNRGTVPTILMTQTVSRKNSATVDSSNLTVVGASETTKSHSKPQIAETHCEGSTLQTGKSNAKITAKSTVNPHISESAVNPHVSNSTEKPHTCELCGKGFTQKSALTQHQKEIHLGTARKFECTIDGCNKTFARKSSLTEHLERMHSALLFERDFLFERDLKHKCGVCGKGFDRPSHLEKHLQIHDENRVKKNARSFVCGVCGERFCRERDLIRHQFGRKAVCGKDAREMELGAGGVLRRKKSVEDGAGRRWKRFCKYCGKGFLHDGVKLRVHEQGHERGTIK